MVGLVGGPLCFAAGVGVLFGLYQDGSGVKFLLTFPEIVREASLGICLVAMGFKASPGPVGETRLGAVGEGAASPAVAAG